MNRRSFVTALAALPAAALAQQPITHVDTNTTGSPVRSSVVPLAGLPAEGAAPGAKAYVNFNGPTSQLAALAAGSVTLAPGAQPHPPHRHPEEEVMIVGEGTGEFSIDGVPKPVKPGDMVFAEANVLHGVKNTGQTQMTFYFIKLMAKHS